MTYKIFISHALEDKELARPLAFNLMSEGYEVWFDELKLQMGDSLSEEIDKGLGECDFAVIILSHSFFAKKWPKRELAGLAAKEIITGRKVLLPVWHNISAQEILTFSPPLADKLAVSSSLGFDTIIAAIKNSIKADLNKLNKVSPDFNYPIHYKSVHFRIDFKDINGKIAYARKANWLYTKTENISVLRDGGIAGEKAENFKSNLGEVDFVREGGTFVAYTHLKDALIPNQMYEHYLEYNCLDSFLEQKEHIGINISRNLEECGCHVFFLKERKPKNLFGHLIYYGNNILIDPIISNDGLFINVLAKGPPAGSRLVLEWEW